MKFVKVDIKDPHYPGSYFMVPVCAKFPADNIFFVNPEDKSCGSNTFPMGDGSTVEVSGAWRSNAKALKEETGMDLTETYSVKLEAWLSEKPYPLGHAPKEGDEVITKDHEFVRGSITSSEEMVQFFANHYGKRVHFFVKTSGGGAGGWKDPK